MADISGLGGGDSSNGIAFLVAVATVMGVTAASCSSPQTMEVNPKRHTSLMRWVHTGQIQAAVLVVIAAMADKKHSIAILSGGGLAIASLYTQYIYAKKRGQRDCDLPGTEAY